MAYDHRAKSGNEGDCVKHVALVAALDALLTSWNEGTFGYADTFAGYAQNVLGEGGAWRRGVGRLAGDVRLDDNPHAERWRRWYLPRPQVRGGAYPGSALIAADVACDRGVPLRLALWDVSPSVVESLEATWGGAATVHPRPARPSDEALVSADFLFVDPPDLTSWPAISDYVGAFDGVGLLLWLPIPRGVTSSPAEEPLDGTVEEAVCAWGLGIDEVRWPAAGRTVGCRLLHRLPPVATDALRRAVGHLAWVAGWPLKRTPAARGAAGEAGSPPACG